jgi:hypothetical protein
MLKTITKLMKIIVCPKKRMENKTLIILVEHFKNILKISLIINVIDVANAWQNPSQKDF